MINLIGKMPPRQSLLAEPGLHWHDYGKEPRPAANSAIAPGRTSASASQCARYGHCWRGSIRNCH